MEDDAGSEESGLNNMTAKLKESPVKIIPFKAKPQLYQAHLAQKQELLLESESEDSAPEVYTQQMPTSRPMVVYNSDSESSQLS